MDDFIGWADSQEEATSMNEALPYGAMENLVLVSTSTWEAVLNWSSRYPQWRAMNDYANNGDKQA